MSGKPLQPIIIKRVKKAGHAVHGGAWKIAYADFVTAMMAFFLLMWLLGSTTKGDLKGIADYFNAPLMVSMMGGDGSGSSSSILTGGGRDLSRSSGQVDGGDAQRAAKLMGAQLAKAEEMKHDRARLEALKSRIDSLITNSPKLAEFRNQIRLEKVQDGLNIQIVDEQNRPMFDVGSAVVKPYMRDILREIGAALRDVENRISLSGHTDATPYGNGDRAYSNWELSADRANASRRELVAAGMPDGKLVRVVGLASSYPIAADQPLAAINRRISVLVMTREAEERINKSFETPVVDDGTALPELAKAVEQAQANRPPAAPVAVPVSKTAAPTR